MGTLVENIDFLLEKTVTDKEIADTAKKAGKLDQIDPRIAKVIVKSGLKDGTRTDDKVRVKKSTWRASELKPSQTSMVLEKAIGMALSMIQTDKIGGDLGAIVSSDNFIMDGHHRWAATILAAGKKGKVGGYAAGLEGEKLLKVLNILTKGMFNVPKGKKGKGKLSSFTPANTKKALKDFAENGIPGNFPKTAEEVQQILEKGFGGVERGIREMSSNARLITKTAPKWAPDRSQMPVIEPEQVPQAQAAMKKGVVDFTKPHAKGNR